MTMRLCAHPTIATLPSGVELDHSDAWMLDFSLEEKCQCLGVNSPHQGPDAKGRSFGRHQLELHGGTRLQPCLGLDSRTMGADIQGYP
jgi:hypothetical protein